MYAFGLILTIFLVGLSVAVSYSPSIDVQYDYYNGYQPCSGSICQSLFPARRIGNVYPANYINSAALVETDVLSTGSSGLVYNYPYNSPRDVTFEKDNYIRDYGYGSTEVGIRDKVSVRQRAPVFLPPYSRICIYFPVGTCQRGINRYTGWPASDQPAQAFFGPPWVAGS